MKVYATINQEVSVNPKHVIVNLIEEVIDPRGWIFEEDGKYYRGYERSMGSHSSDDRKEISKEDFDYVTALKVVLKYMESEER